MNITFVTSDNQVDFADVTALLQGVGMGNYPREKRELAFRQSAHKVFAFDGDKLVGCGRAITDGSYQAAVYDIAVRPEYQRHGIGKTIVSHLLNQLTDYNVILYASPGKERFYRAFGFGRLRTGMGLFKLQTRMRELGFIED